MSYSISQFSSEKDVDDQRRRMSVTWSCGTLRKLGVPFEAEGGAWFVCTLREWVTAENARELCEIARECLADAREMNRAEGPIDPYWFEGATT